MTSFSEILIGFRDIYYKMTIELKDLLYESQLNQLHLITLKEQREIVWKPIKFLMVTKQVI